MLKFWQELEAHKPEIRMSLGLDRIRRVLDRLGRPERHFSTVLIAGTNGKGSTTRFLEQLLLNSVQAVGAYSSPHIFAPTERVRVGGRDVDEATLYRVVAPLYEKFPDLTYFELMTVAAAQIFTEANVETAIFEIGLGGRLDACNALDGVVATAITGIDYDHMHVLGDTLTAIAAEKADIIRPNRSLVTGDLPDEAERVIAGVVAERGARRIPRRCFVLPDWAGPVYLLHNLGVASALAETLGGRFAPETAEAVLAARPFGRWTVMSEKPLKVIDGGHNAQGVGVVAEEFAARLAESSRARIWLAVGAAKDLAGIARALTPVGIGVTAVELAGDGWHAPDKVLASFPAHLQRGIEREKDAVTAFRNHQGEALWLGTLDRRAHV